MITLRSPLYVRGTFKSPQAGVKAGPLIVRGAVAAALATLVTPAAALLLALISPAEGDSEPVSDHFVADEKVEESPDAGGVQGEGSQRLVAGLVGQQQGDPASAPPSPPDRCRPPRDRSYPCSQAAMYGATEAPRIDDTL